MICQIFEKYHLYGNGKRIQVYNLLWGKPKNNFPLHKVIEMIPFLTT